MSCRALMICSAMRSMLLKQGFHTIEGATAACQKLSISAQLLVVAQPR